MRRARSSSSPPSEEEEEEDQFTVVAVYRYLSDDAYLKQLGVQTLRPFSIPGWSPAVPQVASVFDIELRRGAKNIVCPLHPSLSLLVMRGELFPGVPIAVTKWADCAGLRVIAAVRALDAPSAPGRPREPSHKGPLLGARGFYVDRHHVGFPLVRADIETKRRPPTVAAAQTLTGIIQRKSLLDYASNSCHFNITVGSRDLVVHKWQDWQVFPLCSTIAAYVEKDSNNVIGIIPIKYTQQRPETTYNAVSCDLDSLMDASGQVRNISGTVSAIGPRQVTCAGDDAYRFILLSHRRVHVLCTIPAPDSATTRVGNLLRLTDMTIVGDDKMVVCEHTPYTHVFPLEQTDTVIPADELLADQIRMHASRVAYSAISVGDFRSVVNRLLLFEWRAVTVTSHTFVFDDGGEDLKMEAGRDSFTGFESGGFYPENGVLYTSTFAVYRETVNSVKIQLCSAVPDNKIQ